MSLRTPRAKKSKQIKAREGDNCDFCIELENDICHQECPNDKRSDPGKAKEKVHLTPRSSGRPSEPISWQWGHNRKCAHWVHSAGNTARATFPGDSSDPLESSCSSGQQGGAHSLPRSRRGQTDVTHRQTQRDACVFAVMHKRSFLPLRESSLVHIPLLHHEFSHLV